MEEHIGGFYSKLSSINIGVIVYDNSGNMLRVNKFAQSMLEFSPDDFTAPFNNRRLNLTWCYADGAPCQMEETPLYRAFQGETVLNQEMLITRNKRRWISVNISPVRDSNNNLTSVVFVFNDITEHKRIEEELKRREQQKQARNELEISNLLLKAANTLAASIELDEVLESLAVIALEATGHTRAFVNLIDMNKRELVAKVATGGLKAPSGPTISFDQLSRTSVKAIMAKKTAFLDYGLADTPEYDRKIAEANNAKLVLFVPLLINSEIIGHISIDEPGVRHEFSQGEIQLVESITAQAAVAVNNAQLYARMEKELSRTKLLQDIAVAATTALDLSDVAGKMLKALNKHIQLKAGDVKVLDKEKQVLKLLASFGFPEPTVNLIQELPLDKSDFLTTAAIKRKQILTHHDEELTPARIQTLRDLGLKNTRYVVSPIEYRGDIVGAFSMFFEGQEEFTQEEFDLFKSIANIIGQAIENARLFEAEQNAAETLEIVVENTNAMIAYLDLEMNFIMANDAYIAGSGHIRDELIGCNHFDLFPDEENKALFKKVRDTGDPIEFKAKPFEYADQPWRGVTYWDWLLMPVKDAAGRVIGLVFSLVDVTETIRSKQLGDALNNINALISATLDYREIMKLAVIEASKSIRCESAAILLHENSEWIVKFVYGYPPELLGTSFTDKEAKASLLAAQTKQPVIVNDVYKDERVSHEVMLKYGIRSLLSVPLVIKDEITGSLLFLYRTEPCAFTNDQVDFAIKLGYSVSLALENARLFEKERKIALELAEHQKNLELIIKQRTREISDINSLLRQSEAQHRQIIEVSPDAYFVFNQNRILYVNPAALKLLGYKKTEEIDTAILRKVITPEKYKEIINLQSRGKESQKPIHLGELKIAKKEGLPVIVEVTVIPVVFEGEKAHQYIVRDITRRKELEKEMARLDRLNLVGEMAAAIGHEVRNPMTTVRGFLQLLSGKPESQGLADYFTLMIEELDRANSIISEFLSMARDKTVNLQKRNLNAILEAITPLIKADAVVTDKNVSFALGEIPELNVDEKEIRQLILNLVRNGLEAMPPKEVLSIKTYLEGNEVVMAVTDRGCGIEPAVLNKLGTPFFTTKDKGTGLGLAVCYSIAARHNAAIQVDTGSDGTTFRVHFKIK